MANYRECKACREAQERKHKYDGVWKLVAIISTIIAIVFICLYFGSGTVFETTEIDNEVTVENIGDGDPTNTNIGNTNTVDGRNDNTVLYIVIGAFGVLLAGGLIYGYSMAKNRRKKQGNRAKREDGDKATVEDDRAG